MPSDTHYGLSTVTTDTAISGYNTVFISSLLSMIIAQIGLTGYQYALAVDVDSLIMAKYNSALLIREVLLHVTASVAVQLRQKY